jgi:hypothetical protein
MAVCCQNLPLGAHSSRSTPSVLVGVLFKKFRLFLNTVVSPDFSTKECFLSDKNSVLRDTTKGGIQENAIREPRAMTESAFQEAFQQWKKGLDRCIASRVDCFKGTMPKIL